MCEILISYVNGWLKVAILRISPIASLTSMRKAPGNSMSV